MFRLPNLLTGFNLICGILCILFTLSGRIEIASFLLILAMIFDFLDGFAARMLNIKSELGQQLDSLADLVSFGVAPGIITLVMIILGVNEAPIAIEDYNGAASSYVYFQIQAWQQAVFYNIPNQFDASIKFLPFVALLIPFLSMFRLAKFNLDTRQSDKFIGVPTPLNTLFLLFFPIHFCFQFTEWNLQAVWVKQIFDCYFIAGISAVFAFLLISNIPLIALKFKTWSWSDNAFRYVFLISSLVSILFLFLWSIPIIVFLYLLFSLIENRQNKKHEIQS